MTKEGLNKYLARIRFNGNPAADLSTLKELQRHHLLNIPFENLDIHLHTYITINIDNFYEKIVTRKRGGFCYELNGLFNELLTAIGFKTILVSARGFSAPEKYGDEFDHLSILVFIAHEKWLADVGFGEFSSSPLKIVTNQVQPDTRGTFRIVKFNETYFIVQKQTQDNTWKNEYLFSEKPRNILEFAGKCNYHQTSPDSHFTQKKLCSIATESGRVTLTDKVLKITDGNNVVETEIPDFNDFKINLLKHFSITI